MDPTLALPVAGEVITVSQLNNISRRILEQHCGQVWVQGEISNLARPGSGHLYFTLKDGKAQVRCAFFRSRVTLPESCLHNGAEILVRAKVTLYEERGDYQLVVLEATPAGIGFLLKQLEALKAKLTAEGLTTRPRKTIPKWPNAIGVITSATGAAIQDVLAVLGRRYPRAEIFIYATLVQGQQSAPSIAQTLQLAYTHNAAEVLLLVRGGGSLEDLWGFNEESVARMVAASPIPLITGVGHETDRTLVDEVSDMRAPTPSAAAELAAPDQFLALKHLLVLQEKLVFTMWQKWERAAQSLDRLKLKLRDPRLRLMEARASIPLLQNRLHQAIHQQLLRKIQLLQSVQLRLEKSVLKINFPEKQRGIARHVNTLQASIIRYLHKQHTLLASAKTRLHTLHPLATLGRGYCVATNAEGVIIRSVQEVHTGDTLRVRMQDGVVGVEVSEVAIVMAKESAP